MTIIICLTYFCLLTLHGMALANPIMGGHAIEHFNDGIAIPKYQHMVSLQDRFSVVDLSDIYKTTTSNESSVIYQHFCGGSLLNSNWILTAEHCLRYKDKKRIVAVVGSFEDISDVPAYERRVIDQLVFYQNRDIVNDIALLRLQDAVILPKDAYAQLPILGMKVNRRNACLIIGYGAKYYGGKVQKQLFEGEVKIITKRACQHALGVWAPQSHEPTICALGNDQDTCQGDSGGPLLYSYDGVKYVIGIVSHGPTCGMSVPSVYIVVFPFLDWIHNTISTHE